MFEKSLQEKLARIFDITKVSFDAPGEEEEQECIFVEISNSKCRARDGEASFEVRGKITIKASHQKLPFGLFARKIQIADLVDTKDFFFYEIEENAKLYQNLVRRSCSFVYFYNGPLNPDLENIESVEIQ